MSSDRITAKGINGQITVEGDVVVIERKGFLGFALHGHKGAKRISIRDISAVQFKDAGHVTSGYIQFSFQGGTESKAGLLAAQSDENSVSFLQAQAPAFRAVVAYVEQQRRASLGGAAPSGADELEKLAALRDRGVLTDAEFAAQKRRILGL